MDSPFCLIVWETVDAKAAETSNCFQGVRWEALHACLLEHSLWLLYEKMARGEQPLIEAADSQTQFSVHSMQKKTYLLFLLWELSPLSSQHLRDFRERQIGVLGPQLAPLFVQEYHVTAPRTGHTQQR